MWHKTLEKGKQGWKEITHKEALKKAPSGHRLFSGVIPGLSTKMARGDCLHIIFTKGVLGHLLGSILHHFMWYDGVGVTQAVPQKQGWGTIFQAVQQEYVTQAIPTRITNLRMTMITNLKEPHKTWANVDLKASETKWFLMAFTPGLKELVTLEKEHEAAMLHAVEEMAELIQLLIKEMSS